MLPFLAAAPASASILSAASQTVGARSANPEYLRVTVVQNELNATMRDMNDAAVANAPITAEAPVVDEGAYVLQKDGTGGEQPQAHPKIGDLVVPGDGYESGRLSTGSTTHGVRPGHFDNSRGGGRDRRDDPHAAPEPSTWLLVGTGLATLGGYALVRRRIVAE